LKSIPFDVNDAESRSHFKHGYHHLLQFGLIEPPIADTPQGRAERSRGD
jgi:hypothetical protein